MAFATIDQLGSFLKVHLGVEVAQIFIHIGKNSKSTMQMILQHFKVSLGKNLFFPAENLSALKIKKYYEKQSQPSAFEAITSNVQVLKMVQQCLTVLLTHELVTLGRRRSDSALEYSINWPQVRVLLRAPAYLCLVRTQLGHVAELLMEELIYCGRVGLLPCLATVAKRLQEEDDDTATEDAGLRALKTFNELLDCRLVVRRATVVPPVASDTKDLAASDDEGGSHDDESRRYCRIEKPFASLSRAERDAALRHLQVTLVPPKAEEPPPPTKRSRLDEPADTRRPDEAAQEFAANAEELRRQWRDALLARAAGASGGAPAGRVLTAMLAIVGERVRLGHAQSPESEVLAHADIVAQLAALGGGSESRAGLEQQLNYLSDDGLIERLSGIAGGQFRVCYRRAVDAITRQSVAAIVRQRLGDKAVRVFNGLSEQPNLNQAELESLTLLAGRDCKELLYRLLREGFVQCAELTRSAADFMNPRPNTAFYLFHVNLEKTVRKLLLDMESYQDRLLTRRLAEASASRRLLEKQQRVKELLKNLDAQLQQQQQQASAGDAADSDVGGGGSQQQAELAEQRAQAAQLVTPPEREQLAALKRSRTALRAGELLLEENIFLFELFLECSCERH